MCCAGRSQPTPLVTTPPHPPWRSTADLLETHGPADEAIAVSSAYSSVCRHNFPSNDKRAEPPRPQKRSWARGPFLALSSHMAETAESKIRRPGF